MNFLQKGAVTILREATLRHASLQSLSRLHKQSLSTYDLPRGPLSGATSVCSDAGHQQIHNKPPPSNRHQGPTSKEPAKKTTITITIDHGDARTDTQPSVVINKSTSVNNKPTRKPTHSFIHQKTSEGKNKYIPKGSVKPKGGVKKSLARSFLDRVIHNSRSIQLVSAVDAHRSGDKTNSASSFDNNRNTIKTKHQSNVMKPKLQETPIRSYMHGAKTSKVKPGEKMFPACAATMPKEGTCETDIDECERTSEKKRRKKKKKYYMDTPTARKYKPPEQELVLPPPEVKEVKPKPRLKLPKGFHCCARPRQKRTWRKCPKPRLKPPVCLEPKPLEHHCKICTPQPCFSPATVDKVETIKDKVLSNKCCAWKERDNWNKSCTNIEEPSEIDTCCKLREMREKCEKKLNCPEEKKEEEIVCENPCEEVEKTCKKKEDGDTCPKDACKEDAEPCGEVEKTSKKEEDGDTCHKDACKEDAELCGEVEKTCKKEEDGDTCHKDACKEDAGLCGEVEKTCKKKEDGDTCPKDACKEDVKELKCLDKERDGIEKEAPCRELIEELNQSCEKVNDKSSKRECKEECLERDEKECSLKENDDLSKDASCREIEAGTPKSGEEKKKKEKRNKKHTECLMEDCMKKWGIEDSKEILRVEENAEKCEDNEDMREGYEDKCDGSHEETCEEHTDRCEEDKLECATTEGKTPAKKMEKVVDARGKPICMSDGTDDDDDKCAQQVSPPTGQCKCIRFNDVDEINKALAQARGDSPVAEVDCKADTCKTPVEGKQQEKASKTSHTPAGLEQHPTCEQPVACEQVASASTPCGSAPVVVTSAPVPACKGNETCKAVPQCADKCEKKTEVCNKVREICPAKKESKKKAILIANKNRFCKSFSAAGRKKIMKLKRLKRLKLAPVPEVEEIKLDCKNEKEDQCFKKEEKDDTCCEKEKEEYACCEEEKEEDTCCEREREEDTCCEKEKEEYACCEEEKEEDTCCEREEEENPDCNKLEFCCPSFEPMSCEQKAANKRKWKMKKQKKKKKKKAAAKKKNRTILVMECEEVEVSRARDEKEALKLKILSANKRRFLSRVKDDKSRSNCGESSCRMKSTKNCR